MKIKRYSRLSVIEAKACGLGLAIGMATLLAAVVLAALTPVLDANDAQNREIEKDLVIQAIHVGMERGTTAPTPTPGPSTMHMSQKVYLWNMEYLNRVLDRLLRPNDTGPRQVPSDTGPRQSK